MDDGLIAGIPDETDHCVSNNSPLSFTSSPNRQQEVINSNQSVDVNENISSHGSNAGKKTSEHRYSLSQPIETNDSADDNRENDSDSQQCASTQQITEPERARDDGLLRKRRGRRALAPPKVADEFFGVYCLISRSPNKYFKVNIR
ncbi:unnamed protein product [Anisakis simplex]|uniref:Uncharacterized protein n=1 Tax=Anisakis simplex TaxID=6269 RepID=A0A3P6PJX7_ANISI|nr:unnamed protein product [Anisakis simplex]